MKIKKFELIMLVITTLAVVFTVGFFIGRNSTGSVISVSPQVDLAAGGQIAPSEAAGSVSAPISPAESESPTDLHGKVNINTADRDTLTMLPGIGDVLAERIIEYRESYGDFDTADELQNVSGIGSAKLEEIRAYITVE